MPSIAVRLDEDFQARLKKIAQIDNRSPHYVMKKAIESYVSDRETQIKEDQISIERWDEYLRTGVSIPAEEVWDWIDSLANGDSEAA
jgi:predicted transcriptional regulator